MNNETTKRPSRPPTWRPLPRDPVLRFTPTAWAKLLFLRDYGDTEIGGFGLSGFGIAAGDDLLRIEDVQLVEQTCTVSSVAFDDVSVADFFDRQVDEGRQPEQFARVWVHTHPGDSPRPSLTDEETFQRVFGRSDWAVMFILACGGASYARLRFNVGPGGEVKIPVEVDYSRPFAGSEEAAWEQEYQANVRAEIFMPPRPAIMELGSPFDRPAAFDEVVRWIDDMPVIDDEREHDHSHDGDWFGAGQDDLGQPYEESAEVAYE